MLILGLVFVVMVEVWGMEGSEDEGNWVCSGGVEGEEGLLEKIL